MVSTTPKLQYCHHPLSPLSVNPHPLLFHLPTRHPYRQNSNHFTLVSIFNQTDSSSSFKPVITASMAPTPSTERKLFSVLFVCLGNICRSPAAEAVFRDMVNKRGLLSSFNIDSAGTIGYHEVNKFIHSFYLGSLFVLHGNIVSFINFRERKGNSDHQGKCTKSRKITRKHISLYR